jgi:hypothetical protein
MIPIQTFSELFLCLGSSVPGLQQASFWCSIVVTSKVKDFTRFLLDRLGLDIVRSSTVEDFHQFLSSLQPKESGFSMIRVGG